MEKHIHIILKGKESFLRDNEVLEIKNFEIRLYIQILLLTSIINPPSPLTLSQHFF